MKTFIVVRKSVNFDDIFVTVQPNKNCALLHYQRKSATILTIENLEKVCKVYELKKHGDFEYFEL